MVQYFTTKNNFLDWKILFYSPFYFFIYPCLSNLDGAYTIIILMDGGSINGDIYAFPLRYLMVGSEKILISYPKIYIHYLCLLE